ncbi:MAG: carbohydrate ABC transporter permease [Bacillota bacterium]
MLSESAMFNNRYRRFILAAVVPVFIVYVIFMIFPIARSLYYSLFDWSGFTTSMEYVGLGNYAEMASDKLFASSVLNSLKYVAYGGVLIIGITLLFTYAITSYKSKKLKDFVQTILFVPNTISPVALALLWGFVLNTRWGLVNSSLKAIGLGSLARGWLGDEHIFGAALSLLVWIHVGFFIVVYLAGADRIPRSLYEAAELDGASDWKKFTTVTVPLLRDVIETSVVLWTISSFKIFGYIYAFGSGGCGSDPSPAIRNLAVHLYLTAFGKRTPINRLGYASAMAMILLVLVAMLVCVIRRLFRSVERIEY